MNHVSLLGHLTHDPEMRQTPSGVMVARFSVAVNRPVKQGAEKQTDFINCVAFNKTAEFISKYFTKGAWIAVEGSLRTGSYDDKRYPDVKHFTTDVWIEKAHFAGENKGTPQNAQNGTYTGGNARQGNYTNTAAAAPNTGAQAAQSVPLNLNDFEEVISDGDLPF